MYLGPKKELSPVAHKIAVSLQTIAKVKDSQWVHKCLVHKLLMPAFADWACQKGIEEDLGLTSYIDTGSCRVISNPVAMCIISVFGMSLLILFDFSKLSKYNTNIYAPKIFTKYLQSPFLK